MTRIKKTKSAISLLLIVLLLLTSFLSPVMAETTAPQNTATTEGETTTLAEPTPRVEPTAPRTELDQEVPVTPTVQEKSAQPLLEEKEEGKSSEGPKTDTAAINALLPEPLAAVPSVEDLAWPDTGFNILNGKIIVSPGETAGHIKVSQRKDDGTFNTYKEMPESTEIVVTGKVTNTAQNTSGSAPNAAIEAKWKYLQVEDGVNAHITLSGLTINNNGTGTVDATGDHFTQPNGCPPIQVLGHSTVIFTMVGTSTLTAGPGRAGVEAVKSNQDTPTLQFQGEGTLNANGGLCGAAIGCCSGLGKAEGT
ncbi:MAG: hypothetical protein RR528_07485, partial [Angelakisella sp.]